MRCRSARRDGCTLQQQRDPLLVERREAQPLVEAPCAGVVAMAARCRCASCPRARRWRGERARASRRRRRGPASPASIVTSSSLATTRAARRRDRVADDARADRLRVRRRSPTRATRSRARAARGTGRARGRAPRRRRRRSAAPMRGSARRRARNAPSSARASARVAAVIGAQRSTRHAHVACTVARRSGSSAARMRGGTATGRCVARSTQTWTKRPVAAGVVVALPEQPDLVGHRRASRAARRASPASIVSGNDSGAWKRQPSRRRARSTGVARMSSPPARIRCSFTAVSKYE